MLQLKDLCQVLVLGLCNLKYFQGRVTHQHRVSRRWDDTYHPCCLIVNSESTYMLAQFNKLCFYQEDVPKLLAHRSLYPLTFSHLSCLFHTTLTFAISITPEKGSQLVFSMYSYLIYAPQQTKKRIPLSLF